jgi:hypothetical protein
MSLSAFAVWWLNGGNPQNAFSNGGPSAAATLDALTQWNDLPLKPGDVIAHRFRNEWEECFAGAKLSVNGEFIAAFVLSCVLFSL